jgi:hypothetical protein
VRLRDFLAQIMEKFMQSPRRYAKDFSNHGASRDGSGFSEENPSKHIMLRWDAESVYNLLAGCPSSHSVGSRNDTALKQHRREQGEHDAFLPAALLEHGRAAERFLPTLKAQLAAEKNVDSTARFVWNRDAFVIEGVGLVGMTMTEPPPQPHTAAVLANRGGQTTVGMTLSPLQVSLKLLLRCAWKMEKKIVIDSGNNVLSYSIEKTVRRVVCNGKCVEKMHHPKGHGENVLMKDVKHWVEYYWQKESELHATDKSKDKWQDWTGDELERRRELRTQVKERGHRNEGKTALSYLRSPELVEEFLRLDQLYPESDGIKSPMPCRRTGAKALQCDMETSWRGGGLRWPTEFDDARKVSQKVAEEMEDAGGTLEQAVERAGTDGVANAARLAELTGEEPALQKRRRGPPRRPGGD